MVDGPQLMRLKIMRAMCQILRQHALETWEDEEDKEEEEEEEERQRRSGGWESLNKLFDMLPSPTNFLVPIHVSWIGEIDLFYTNKIIDSFK
jgi:hypothetical protein